MNDDLAIRVENLTKMYRLYGKPVDRLKEALHPLRKSYHKDFYALNGVSFEIKKGETVGIIGKNGSGKSTLLKIITGVLTPNFGSVEVNGNVSALLELGAGFNPEMTGMENVYLNGTIMGYSKEEMDEKVDGILDFADIGSFIYQPVKIYSSGMFARLAFALAINVDPDILIVDEALSVGDAAFQLKCYRKIEEFRTKKKTILLVTHSQETIIRYCTTAFLINNGKFIEKGTPKNIVDQYKKLTANLLYTDDKSLSLNSDKELNPKELIEKELIHKEFYGKKWCDNFPVNVDHIEYGDKRAEIIDYGMFNQFGEHAVDFYSNENILVRIKVFFHKTIGDPIFAVTIKDTNGFEIVGTNTLAENIKIPATKKGSIIDVSFEFIPNLRTGAYSLNLGCTELEGDGLTVYHRLYDIIIFNIVSLKQTIGLFNLDAVIDAKIAVF